MLHIAESESESESEDGEDDAADDEEESEEESDEDDDVDIEDLDTFSDDDETMDNKRHPSSFQQLEKLGEGTYATVRVLSPPYYHHH